jgi:hypothetical protein
MQNLGGGGSDLQKKFITNAIAPILIGIPLSIGFIMLSAFKGVGTPPKLPGGADLNLFNLAVSGVEDMQKLIMAFGICAVVWIGVFAAAEGTIAKDVVNQVRGFVGGVGKKIASLPQYAPLIPVADGKKGSLFELTQRASHVLDQPRARAQRDLNVKLGISTREWGEIKTKEGFLKNLQGAQTGGKILASDKKPALQAYQKLMSKNAAEARKIATGVLGPKGTPKQLERLLKRGDIGAANVTKYLNKAVAKDAGTRTPVAKAGAIIAGITTAKGKLQIGKDSELKGVFGTDVTTNADGSIANDTKYANSSFKKNLDTYNAYSPDASALVKAENASDKPEDVAKRLQKQMTDLRAKGLALSKDKFWALFKSRLQKLNFGDSKISAIKTKF